MRRYLLSMAVVGSMGVLVAPAVGVGRPEEEDAVKGPAVTTQQPASPLIRDEAAMVIIGAALIGLAAAVRRAA